MDLHSSNSCCSRVSCTYLFEEKLNRAGALGDGAVVPKPVSLSDLYRFLNFRIPQRLSYVLSDSAQEKHDMSDFLILFDKDHAF